MFYSLWSVSIWFVYKLHRPFPWFGSSERRENDKVCQNSFSSQLMDYRHSYARKTHLQFNMLLSNNLPFAFYAFVAAATAVAWTLLFPMKRQYGTKFSVSSEQILRMHKMYYLLMKVFSTSGVSNEQTEKKFCLLYIQFIDRSIVYMYIVIVHLIFTNPNGMCERSRSRCCRQFFRILFSFRFFCEPFKWDGNEEWKKGAVAVDSHMINSSANFIRKHAERTIISIHTRFAWPISQLKFLFLLIISVESVQSTGEEISPYEYHVLKALVNRDRKMHFPISVVVKMNFIVWIKYRSQCSVCIFRFIDWNAMFSRNHNKGWANKICFFF